MVPLNTFFQRAVRTMLTSHAETKLACWLVIGIIYNFVFYHRPILCAYCSRIVLVKNARPRRTPEGLSLPRWRFYCRRCTDFF
jgi:hypothetical protein